MKKTIIFGLCVLFSLTSNAQVRVDSVGRLSQMPNQSASGYSATIQALENGGLLIKRDYQSNKYTKYGLNVNVSTNDNDASGIRCNVSGMNINVRAFGTQSVASGGAMTIGVYGGLSYAPYNAAGVFGSTTYPSFSPTLFSGVYAGFFYGNVKVTGTIYGTLVTPSSVSSPSGVGTTTNLSIQATRGESITEKLGRVDLLQMERMNQDGSIAANKVVEKGTYIDEDGNEKATQEPIQTKLSDISYGLAADQLKEVYPELVYEDEDGNYSINYVEMVPLLVQSIRELSANVTELKQQLGISEHTKSILKTKGKAEDADNVTLILPDKMQEATLNVYNLSGNLLCTVPVGATDATNLSSYTRGLPTGTYVYCLTVDGRQQKARKVIVK